MPQFETVESGEAPPSESQRRDCEEVRAASANEAQTFLDSWSMMNFSSSVEPVIDLSDLCTGYDPLPGHLLWQEVPAHASEAQRGLVDSTASLTLPELDMTSNTLQASTNSTFNTLDSTPFSDALTGEDTFSNPTPIGFTHANYHSTTFSQPAVPSCHQDNSLHNVGNSDGWLGSCEDFDFAFPEFFGLDTVPDLGESNMWLSQHFPLASEPLYDCRTPSNIQIGADLSSTSLTPSTDTQAPLHEASTTLAIQPSSPSAKRKIVPDQVELKGQFIGPGGQVEATLHKFKGVSNLGQKRTKTKSACERCKKLKMKCEGLKMSPYVACSRCQKMTTPSFLSSFCIIDAYLSGIDLFRLGPSPHNPTHPLNFRKGRIDVLLASCGESSASPLELDVELTQDEVGQVLGLAVSRYRPLPGDKVAYEGKGQGGPYRLELPPYSINDIDKARRTILEYVERTKFVHIDKLVDSSNALLWTIFQYAKDYRGSLTKSALSIWVGTRLIERTWRLCGRETFGIDPSVPREDPWNGHVPVTPIMDQQLDQIVIREYLLPRQREFLATITKKMTDDKERKASWFDITLSTLILLNSSEMHIASSRTFAQRYGLSGRYGAKGRYPKVEAQIHAARTLLGHFHHTCRGGSILSGPPSGMGGLPLSDTEKQLVARLRRSIVRRKPYFESLVAEGSYETDLYFVHQMFEKVWDGGTGHIKELDI